MSKLDRIERMVSDLQRLAGEPDETPFSAQVVYSGTPPPAPANSRHHIVINLAEGAQPAPAMDRST